MDLYRRLALNPSRRYLLFVGEAIFRKGLDVVIEAFIRLCRTMEDVDLLIVGRNRFSENGFGADQNNRLIEALKQNLAAAGCADRVHWIGLADNVQEYMQIANIFFFPTRREGLPNVVGEAMASGLPVLASHLEGITTDFFENGGGGGLLVRGYDPGDYTARLESMFTDRAGLGELSVEARRRAVSAFSNRAVVATYISLYSELAA
jgi:glycosyltransferase involved in cell wall biosynthesis